MKNQKLMKLLLIILPACAVVLTALPQCVKMRFAAPEPEPAHIEYCSGFSLLPAGYGNWGPMLAGVSSCILVMLAIVYWFRSTEKLENRILGLAVAGGGILAAASLFFGSGTVISWVIVIVLGAEALLSYKLRK